MNILLFDLYLSGLVEYLISLHMERLIYHEEIEGVNVEWFEATGTLVLDISSAKKLCLQEGPRVGVCL